MVRFDVRVRVTPEGSGSWVQLAVVFAESRKHAKALGLARVEGQYPKATREFVSIHLGGTSV